MYYSSLQTLRGFFALMIFFHHFNFKQNEGGMFNAGGDCGVAFFFILSGFVLMAVQLKRNNDIISKKKYKFFLIKRLSKIYPLHILCLLGAMVLKASISITDIPNVFLMQAWIPLRDWYFSGNAVGWCLSDFLFFYAVFPFLSYYAINKTNKFYRYFLLVLILYSCILPFIPQSIEDGIVYINPLTRCLDFVFGMTLCLLHNNRLSNFKINFIGIIFLFILSIIVWHTLPSKFNLSLLWWPSVGLLILTCVNSSYKLLSLKPLVRFGDVSFSFYLIHVLVINFIDIFIRKLGLLEMNPIFRLFVILSSTIILAFIVHRYFVVPIESYIRGLINKSSSTLAGYQKY